MKFDKTKEANRNKNFDLNNNNVFENEYYNPATVFLRNRNPINPTSETMEYKDVLSDVFIGPNEGSDNEDPEPFEAFYFKRRFCHRYVRNPHTNLCDGCKFKEFEGFHLGVHNQPKWDYETCTQLAPTDAYGKLIFPGSHSKTASYIRVQNKTSPADMIEFLYNKRQGSNNAWNMTRPQLILSVTGGAQKFTLPYRMKKAFKSGLVKAAASTGAWIITGGTNTGVMRLVGEAVADEYHTTNLVVLGIATWGVIGLREKLIKREYYLNHRRSIEHARMILRKEKILRDTNSVHKKVIFTSSIKRSKKQVSLGRLLERQISHKESTVFYAPDKTDQASGKGVFLDPNHTHFILVDDGSQSNFGKEIEFRANFEAELRRGKSLDYYEKKRKGAFDLNKQHITNKEDTIPMILIVVQGGPNTLLTVEESLKKNVPVLVLADSKGCADLIANACLSKRTDKESLMTLVKDSGMFDPSSCDFEKKAGEAVDRLGYILSRLKQNLINVFHLDSEECGSDIELPILRAFLNTQKNQHYENLKLALQWNRSDIAKNYIFTGEEEFHADQLANLMEMALLQNKPEFVMLLLQNGLNLNSFLTVKRLYFLYNSHRAQTDVKRAPLFQRFKKKYKSGPSSSSSSSSKHGIITFNSLIKLLKDYLFEDFEPDFLPKDVENTKLLEHFLRLANKNCSTLDTDQTFSDFGTSEVTNPAQNLFLWALLLNRIQIATLFWQIGEYQICTALFASHLLKSIASQFTDLGNELRKSADDFEDMAIGVLQIFDKTTDDILNGVILLRRIPFYGLDCLQMAVEGDCQKFVALSAVQNLLTDIWYGKIEINDGLWDTVQFAVSCLSLGLLAPVCLFKGREKLLGSSDRKWTLKSIAVHSQRQDISRLLKEYLANFEIKSHRDANLLPSCCYDQDNSSSSDSSDDYSDNSYESEPHKLANHDQKPKNTSSRLTTYFSLYKRFVHSPRVHFVYDAVFYILFLTLFSYTVLCELTFFQTVNIYKSTLLNASTNQTILIKTNQFHKIPKEPSTAELVLIFWILMFILEELRQYLFGGSQTKVIKNRLRQYLANHWNYLDINGCLVFIVGMSLRIIAFFQHSEALFTTARLVLCIDLFIWYMRLLHLSIVFKSLGPKLVMIQKMIQDLMFFMSIIAIFVCAFGVTTQAMMHPGSQLGFKLIQSIVNKGYWPVYGEMKILDELGECVNKTSDACPDSTGVVFSYIALMFYMVIANVLLINLLIAMFSSTFQDVQDNTDQIWKFQRYRLVFEYYDSPILPPPLNFIAYFVSMISFLRTRVQKNPKKRITKKNQSESEKKSFLEDTSSLEDKKDEIDLLLDREKVFAEEFLRGESNRKKDTIDSRLKANFDRLENLEHKLNEVIEGRTKEIGHISDCIQALIDRTR